MVACETGGELQITVLATGFEDGSSRRARRPVGGAQYVHKINDRTQPCLLVLLLAVMLMVMLLVVMLFSVSARAYVIYFVEVLNVKVTFTAIVRIGVSVGVGDGADDVVITIYGVFVSAVAGTETLLIVHQEHGMYHGIILFRF